MPGCPLPFAIVCKAAENTDHVPVMALVRASSHLIVCFSLYFSLQFSLGISRQQLIDLLYILNAQGAAVLGK